MRAPLPWLRRFRRSDAGAIAPILGVSLLVLIGCIGLAVDTGRAMVVRSRLANALDAAGLAVGARLGTSDFTADATKFVNANFVANYASATVTSVTAVANSTNTVITLNATADMPTTFMKLFGHDVVTVAASSEVTRTADLELVMALDNTWSMQTSRSMPALRDAAEALVNFMFGDKDTADNLFVGLVPFSQAVNIGTSVNRRSWISDMESHGSDYPSKWTGCVEARESGRDQTDEPPLAANPDSLFKSYYNPPERPRRTWGRSRIDYSDGGNQKGPGAYCPTAMTPMTNVKKTVLDGITAMKPGGFTHINLGAVWGWRMLSPRWRDVWDGDMAANNLPRNYGGRAKKALVLMTDGANTMPDGYTAYGEKSDDRPDPGELNVRLANVCKDAKAAGVMIFAVPFNITDTGIKSLMQNCASSTAHYFDAPDEESLVEAFQLIGNSLSNLRVSR